MAYEPLEILLSRCGNSIYKLVRIAANRAGELADNQPALIPNTSSYKLTTIALKEILAGKVMLKGEKPVSSKNKKESAAAANNN